jgi:transcriptional regulator with XRE-family HTH domain
LPFADLLRQYRVAAGFTQEELAERAGLSARAISDLERGVKQTPRRETLRLLVDALHLSADERLALEHTIRRPVAHRPALAEPSPSEVAPLYNPYKGLCAFQEADAPDFFGREALTGDLLARLKEPAPLARFLAVVGPSGSGKSSVVRAGLLPSLRQGALPTLPSPTVISLIPGAHPWAELAASLLPFVPSPPAALLDQLLGDEHGLLAVTQHLAPALPGGGLVLLIDQFEELFTLVQDEPTRRHFLSSVLTAVAAPACPLHVLVTLRAEFYDRPLLYEGSYELLRQRTALVGPLTTDEVQRAIMGPAERVGLRLEPGLVPTILADMAEQPGALPLLEYALTELFERREDHQLTLAAYRTSGGLGASLGRRAETLYRGLTPTEQEAARQVFLRLVTLGEGEEDTRRRARRAELASAAADDDALDEVLAVFGRYRLLTFDRDPVTGGPTVEVAHEALLRTWDRLREWLAASRRTLQVQRRLQAAASEWGRGGQEASYLATGVRLAEFAGVVAEGDVALTAEERGYLEAGLAAQEAERVAAAERQARELALARQATVAAEQAAATHRSATRR